MLRVAGNWRQKRIAQEIRPETADGLNNILSLSVLFGSYGNLADHLAVDSNSESPELNKNSSVLGATPLCFATSFGMIEKIKKLIACGASADITDNKGKAPLDWACDGDHTEAVKFLVFGSRGTIPSALSIADNAVVWAKVLKILKISTGTTRKNSASFWKEYSQPPLSREVRWFSLPF
ncbi:ankyrin repeat domain-containing [Paramuricea clavata]|uniref:Ankyrin repeat domain-containing n=1 Tax=Paramuricea clavata TaxID=317549 RepID=A0A7D9EIQ4_PARCT|nr:ankyrin repeat domain-containing [Paramuricea clavata]